MENDNKNISIKLVTPTSLVLFALFFLAKIFDKIDWSWWWIFSPLWIPFALIIIIVLGWLLLLAFATLLDYFVELWKKWKENKKKKKDGGKS